MASQVEYIRTKKIHVLLQGMIETILANPTCTPKTAVTAFLLSGGKFPEKNSKLPFVLTTEEQTKAGAFLQYALDRQLQLEAELMAKRQQMIDENARKEAEKMGPSQTPQKPPSRPPSRPSSRRSLRGGLPPVIDAHWAYPSQSVGSIPTPRAGHAICGYESKVWVFGGNNQGSFINDLHSYDTLTGVWEAPEVFGAQPPPRAGHSMTYFTGMLWVFGGADTSRSFFNDCFSFHIATSTWIKVNVRGSVAPSPRAGHSAVMVGDKLWVFGGEETHQCLGDLYSLNLVSMEWQQPQVSGVLPRPRGGHSCVAHNRELWVYGGDDRSAYLHDLFVLNLDTLAWREVVAGNAVGVPPPVMRGGHVACVMTLKSGGETVEVPVMVVFGGVNDDGFLSDVAVLDFEGCCWRAVQAGGVGPAACSGHSCCWVMPPTTSSSSSGTGKLAVFGGYDDLGFRATLHTLEFLPLNPLASLLATTNSSTN